jgi:hypothetical protein
MGLKEFGLLKRVYSALLPNIPYFSPRRRLYEPEANFPLFQMAGISIYPLIII